MPISLHHLRRQGAVSSRCSHLVHWLLLAGPIQCIHPVSPRSKGSVSTAFIIWWPLANGTRSLTVQSSTLHTAAR